MTEIKRLFKRDEPLNICAVRRQHPRLLDAVYDIKPFWGWKRALEAAGIDYADIRVELLDYVVCEICGEEFGCLGFHLSRTHEVISEDYKIDYPDADFVCETVRASMTRMHTDILKHWERIWSPEYVLDRIAEFHRHNISLNVTFVKKHDSTLSCFATKYFSSWDVALRIVGLDPISIRLSNFTTYLTKKSCIKAIRKRKRDGLPLNAATIQKSGINGDKPLYVAGMSFFKSWAKLLLAAGFDPAIYQVHNPTPYPTKTHCIMGIRKRKRDGLSLNYAAMYKGNSKDSSLCKAVKNLFGSWDAALLAAGLDPSSIRRWNPTPYLTKAHCIKAIRKRKRDGLPLPVVAMAHESNRNIPLFEASKKLFGTWDKALLASELDPLSIRRRNPNLYPTKTSCIKAIKKRKRDGLPLNYAAMYKGNSKDSSLIHAVEKIFSSWDAALRAAGLDLHSIRLVNPCPYSTKTHCIMGIRKRKRDGLPLNCAAVNGGKHSNSSLSHAVMRNFGSWDAALSAAGFDPASIKLRQPSPYKTKKSCIVGIKKRKREGLALNSASIQTGMNHNRSLFEASKKNYGSWNKALLAAGFDPASIRLYNPNPYRTKKSCIEAIKKRKCEGLELNHASIKKGVNRNYALFDTAMKLFGSWNAALLAAGLDLHSIRLVNPCPYSTKELCIQAIEKRKRNGLPLNFSAVATGSSSNSSLSNAVKKCFTSWDAALLAAGFDPASIKLRQPNPYKTKKSCVKAIKKRKREGLRLNTTSIQKGADRNLALFNTASKLFGSWDNTLRAAGLDPPSIRRWNPTPYLTKAHCIREIKRRRNVGLPLNHWKLQQGTDSNMALLNSAKRRFGSWRLAIEAAGFDYDKIYVGSAK